jgi:hypothetical protein
MRRPSSAAGMLKKGEACLAPTEEGTFVGATHAALLEAGGRHAGHPKNAMRFLGTPTRPYERGKLPRLVRV